MRNSNVYFFYGQQFTSFSLCTHLGINNIQARDVLNKKTVMEMHYHWRQTAAKKWNMATFNSAHQAKKECNFDNGWSEQHLSSLHTSF